MTDLSQLIERIEAAEGPDRVIDVLIGAAVRWLPKDGQAWLRDWRGDFGPMPRMTGRISAFHDNGEPAVHWEAPNFSASVDAAMTLVPEGAGLSIQRYWIASVDGPVWSVCISTGGIPSNPRQVFECYDAANAALALCAAALRAHQAKAAA